MNDAVTERAVDLPRYPLSDTMRRFLREKYLRPQAASQWTGTHAEGSPRPALLGRDRAIALLATITLLVVSALCGQAHAADMVLAESAAVIGTHTNEYAFDVAGPGTLDVSLADLKWPNNPFADLSLEIDSPTGVLQRLGGPGQIELQLPGAGTYYAFVTGVAGPSDFGFNMGVFGLIGTMTSPVPLPASVTLLGAGLLITMWSMRRRGGMHPLRHFRVGTGA